jgi:hypothetical protein
MKKVILSIAVLMFLVAASVIAAPSVLPGSGWWSPFQIQNVSEDIAVLTYTAYWQEGVGGSDGEVGITNSQEITLASGSSVVYNPALPPNYPDGPRIGFETSDYHLPGGFAGGVSVVANRPIRAVVTVNNFRSQEMGVHGGRASAYYQSVQEPASLLNFPVMKHDYWNQTTTFYIQAAGGDAVINATFYGPGGTIYAPGGGMISLKGIRISEGRTYMLDPAAADVPFNTLGSLVVEATSGKIAGGIMETQHTVDVGTFALSTKALVPSDADITLYAPTNKTRYWGGMTGWQLLNTTSEEATVDVTFTIAGVEPGSPADLAGIKVGEQFDTRITIPGEGNYLFSVGTGNYYKALRGTIPITDGLFFSGEANSTQPLVATVNEFQGRDRILYSAFGRSGATRRLAAPAVKESFFGQNTSLNVQNVGDQPVRPTAFYNCSDGETYTVESPNLINPGQSVNFFRLSDASRWGEVKVPEGNNCAVIVTAEQSIVAVAQESMMGGTQDIKNYEGLSLP